MKTDHAMNGSLKFYVSILPALFPAIVLLSASIIPVSIRVNPASIETNPIVAKVRGIYTSQIGVREKRENSGPEVEQYLKYVNLPKGNPWCAAFVCWVYSRAGVGNPRSGWTPDLFKTDKVIWSRAESRKLKAESSMADKLRFPAYAPSRETGNWQLVTPGTGDIFGLFFPEKGRIAHAGFIDQWDGTWLITVEGNTNESGSREGDGVYRKWRLVRSVYKVARYIPRKQSSLASPGGNNCAGDNGRLKN